MENARLGCVGAVCLFVSICPAIAQDYRDQIGYTRLKSELGLASPTGAGVPVVQAETGVASIQANPTAGEFAGKHFEFINSAPATVDGHAQAVGTIFYGNTSIAPGITNITSYPASFTLAGLQTQPILLVPKNYSSNPIPGDANLDGIVDNVDMNIVVSGYDAGSGGGFTNGDFNGDGVVDMTDFAILTANWGRDARTPQLTQPAVSRGRVSNHSYLLWSDSMRRIDYMAATDDTVMVVAVNNNERIPPLPGDSGYLAGAFNTISVGRLDGLHTTEIAVSSGPYVAGRQAPLLVAPASKTSFATPIVSAAAALLIDTAHTRGSELSSGSYTSPRTGKLLYNAESLEVIKAALLAGANRKAIGSYTVNSTNGLDKRFGAGLVNVYNSQAIIRGGEQNSRERGNLRYINRTGFDYDKLPSNQTASYIFSADLARRGMVASLVWNLKIDGGTVPYWDDTATLYHYNLGLFDLTAGGTQTALSSSAIENTQNIYLQNLVPGHRYIMQVTAAAGQTPFTWDFGLAWRFTPDPSIVLSSANGVYTLFNGDLNADGRVDSVDYTVFNNNWGRVDARWDQGDFNGDGIVNGIDFSMLSANFGAVNPNVIGNGSLGDVLTVSVAVPEPGTVSAAIGALVLSRRRCRRKSRSSR